MPATKPPTTVTDDQIIDALQRNAGLVAPAAQALKIHRNTIHNRIKKSARVRKAKEEIREDCLDLAEGTILKLINEGNVTATIFFLKCQGKDRGWVERPDSAGKDAGSVREGGVVKLPERATDMDAYYAELEAQQTKLVSISRERAAANEG